MSCRYTDLRVVLLEMPEVHVVKMEAITNATPFRGLSSWLPCFCPTGWPMPVQCDVRMGGEGRDASVFSLAVDGPVVYTVMGFGQPHSR